MPAPKPPQCSRGSVTTYLHEQLLDGLPRLTTSSDHTRQPSREGSADPADPRYVPVEGVEGSDGLTLQRVHEIVRHELRDHFSRSVTKQAVPLEFAFQRISEDYDGGHDSFRDAVRSTVFLLDADRLRGPEPP